MRVLVGCRLSPAFSIHCRTSAPAVPFALVFPSRFHLPTPLGSTVVTRFLATMGALTPALLLPAPGQVSLITDHALPDIQSPPTPCAPVPAMLLAPGRLCLRFAWAAIGGSSDFAHYSQSRQSHKAVSSSYRGIVHPLSSIGCLFASSCSPPHLTVTQLLSVHGGKLRHRGTSTLLCTLSLKARARPSRSLPSASRRWLRQLKA